MSLFHAAGTFFPTIRESSCDYGGGSGGQTLNGLGGNSESKANCHRSPRKLLANTLLVQECYTDIFVRCCQGCVVTLDSTIFESKGYDYDLKSYPPARARSHRCRHLV